jgi:hypothetical protein
VHYFKADFAIVPTAISATPAAIATNGFNDSNAFLIQKNSNTYEFARNATKTLTTFLSR